MMFNHPRFNLTQENVNQINNFLMEDFAETPEKSGYSPGTLDNGTFRIKCFNQKTIERLKQLVKTIRFMQDGNRYPFILISEKDFPKYIYMSCRVEEVEA